MITPQALEKHGYRRREWNGGAVCVTGSSVLGGWRGHWEWRPSYDLQAQALRERVAKLEAQVRFLYKHFGVTYVPGQFFELDPADKEVAEWLKKGDEMRAVAAYRSVHKVSLAEAKTAVEEIRAGLG